MGYFDADMEDMLDIYLLETNQLMEQADGILIRAEKSGKFTSEDINEIFRIMHTMKSSSAMMGLSELSGLCHRLEDMFAVFREDPGKLQCCMQETFDLLFEATDFVRSELQPMLSEDYSPRDTEKLNGMVDVLLSKMRGQKRIAVRLRFEKNCKMENIRAFMAARQIKNMCSELAIYPEDVEKNSETIGYIKKNGFFISFISEEPEQVLEKLRSAIFVEGCDLVDDLPEGGVSRGKEQEPGAAVQNPEEEYISVRVEKLDKLQDLTGEMMIAISALEDEMRQITGARENDTEHRVNKILKELGDLSIALRMVSLKGLVPKIERLVRDMCKKERKEVSFTVKGQDVEVDKKIVDSILEPLTHMIRNSVDHGIELPEERVKAGKPRAGQVELEVENTGGEIIIHLRDDGAGMDLDRIREKARIKNMLAKPEEEYTDDEILELCLIPGFSTRETANEFSGRGVGLDVVRQMVERFGGHLELKSELGKGSRFLLHLPLTLTIVNSILVRSGSYSFALPSYQVVQFIPYQKDSQNMLVRNGRNYWIDGGRCIPVIFVEKLLNPDSTGVKAGSIMIHIQGATKEACLVVEQVREQRSLVEKALPPIFGQHFKYYTGISGCSTLGDGSVCMMLDIEDLIRIVERRDGI